MVSSTASQDQKNLVYLTLEAPREGQASYVHVREIIAGLRKLGWATTLFEPPYTCKQTSPGLVSRFFHALALQAQLWAGWKRGGVLYVRAHYLAFPSVLIAKFFGIPVFNEINGPYEDVFIAYPELNKFRSILIWIQRQQYRWSRALIAVTEELRYWAHLESLGRPTSMISNGANVYLFKPGYPKPENLPDKYVIFFGGLTAWHGVRLMIEAVNAAAWPDDVHLVVIGDGIDGPALRKAAEINSRILPLGKMKYQDIPAYIGSAIAGLVPITNPGGRSDTGLFPLKLFETLACGIPAIVTDFPGQADLVRNHDCGIVIACDNPGELAQAVKDIAQNPDNALRMGRNGKDLIVSAHSWWIRAQQTDQFIRSHI